MELSELRERLQEDVRQARAQLETAYTNAAQAARRAEQVLTTIRIFEAVCAHREQFETYSARIQALRDADDTSAATCRWTALSEEEYIAARQWIDEQTTNPVRRDFITILHSGKAVVGIQMCTPLNAARVPDEFVADWRRTVAIPGVVIEEDTSDTTAVASIALIRSDTTK